MSKLYSLLRVPYLLAQNLMHIGLFPFVLLITILTPVFSYTRAYAQAHVRTHARKLILVALLAVIMLPFVSDGLGTPTAQAAASNNTINFQARLLTASGAVVPDGTYNISFKLYNVQTPAGGTTSTSCGTDSTCLWDENYTVANNSQNGNLPNPVTVVDGYLSVQLGQYVSFPTTINWDQPLYLGMNVGGTNSSPTWDGEMTPRLQLTAVPYALRAGTLAQGNGSYENTLSWVSGQSQTSNDTLTLPNESGILCVEGDTAGCQFAALSGSANYIQNNSSSTVQPSSAFYISGSGISQTSFTAPLIQAPTSTALTMQGGNTVTTGSNNSDAANGLALLGGEGTGTGVGGNITFKVAPAGASGSTLNGYASAPVLTLSGATGAATFENAVNSTNALSVETATAGLIFNVNTTGSGGVAISGVPPASSGTRTDASAILTVTGPAGGANTAASGTAGTGAGISETAGAGGAESGASGIGGTGGAVNIQSGNGGTGATNGSGGNITLSAGAAASGGTGGAAGSVVVKNQSNSSTAFQVQNTSSADLFEADTADSKVSIGAAVNTAGSTLQVNGDIGFASSADLDTANTDTYLCLNSSNEIASCSSSGAAFIQGGNSFGTGLTNHTAILGTSDANSLEIGTYNGTALQQRILISTSTSSSTNATLTFSGTSVFQPTANSTTAFQIQTAGGTPSTILNVDTTNSGAVTIAGVTPTTAATAASTAFTVNGASGSASTSSTVGGAGAGTTINGGAGGANSSTGAGGTGGTLSFTAGAGGASSSSTGGTGGEISLLAGAGGTGTAGAGGAISILAGNGSGTNGAAGTVSIDSGTSTGTGTTGTVSIGGTNARAINLGNATSTTVDSFTAGTYGLKVTNTGVGITSGGTAVTPNADLTFAGTATTRTIDVAQNSSGNGTGLSIQAGSTTAATSNGGNVTLQAGTGTSANGTVIVKSVGTDSSTNPTFAVQNAGGTDIFSVIASTTQPQVIIGNPSSFSNLGYQSTDNLIVKQAEFTGQIFIGTGSGTSANGLLVSSTSANAYEPTLVGTARHPVAIDLSPEYPGATLTNNTNLNTASDLGTMTAGFCSQPLGISSGAGTACPNPGDSHNYYNWTTNQSSNQGYDVFLKYQIPSNFNALAATNPITFSGMETNTANDEVGIYIYQSTSSTSACASNANVPTTNNTWTTASISTGTCSFTAGSTIEIDVHLQAGTNDNARAGDIVFNYLSSY